MNIALIFAGGVGTRMGLKIPKQYIELGGKPILIWTLERFEKEEIDGVYLVVKATRKKEIRDLIEKFKITKVKRIINSGNKALDSIYHGLIQMEKDRVADNDIVLIHDGVRPIVSDMLIKESINMARELGNSICSRPVTETIAIINKSTIEKTTKRDATKALQAPQVFRFGEILELYKKALSDEILDKCVDSAQVALNYGTRLYWLDGIKENVKLTTMYDLEYFRFLLDNDYEEIVNG